MLLQVVVGAVNLNEFFCYISFEISICPKRLSLQC